MLSDRFHVVTFHGERRTTYCVVDREAPDADQPCVMSTYCTDQYSAGARGCAEYAAEVLNGRGYPGDAARMSVLARCRY